MRVPPGYCSLGWQAFVTDFSVISIGGEQEEWASLNINFGLLRADTDTRTRTRTQKLTLGILGNK